MKFMDNIKEYMRKKGVNTPKEDKAVEEIVKDPISQAIVQHPVPVKTAIPGPTRAGRVLIASLEDAGSRLVLGYVENPGPGVYDDSSRGLGGQYLPSTPLTIINHGKPEIGFLVNGDHGVPVKLTMEEPKEGENPKESKSILSLTCSAKQAHALLDVHVFAEAYRQRMLGREKLMYIVLIIIANLVGVVVHV
jgi:hypothetical protein